MIEQDLTALVEISAVFEKLGIRYLLGGSMASSLHGLARFTNDFDFLALIPPSRVREFVKAVEQDFYVDEQAVSEAVRTQTPFNLIHQRTFDKVDVFTRAGEWERLELKRAQRITLSANGAQLMVSTPEDIVLRKLDWYRQGGGVSDKQWNDILGVLKFQGEQFDRDYAVDQSRELGLSDLLDKAFDEAT